MANSLGMITRGPALSEEHGAHLGRGMGEQTGSEREVRNGPTSKSMQHQSPESHTQHQASSHQSHGGPNAHDGAAKLVPGAPFLECGARPCGNGDWRGPDGNADPEEVE